VGVVIDEQDVGNSAGEGGTVHGTSDSGVEQREAAPPAQAHVGEEERTPRVARTPFPTGMELARVQPLQDLPHDRPRARW
jgi:hypothetical protein